MEAVKPNGNAKWTIAVYIAADGTLANFAINSLTQLQETAGGPVKVAAQFAAANGKEVFRLIFDGTDKNKSIFSSEREKLPASTNMDDPETLTKFIEWVCKECTAEHFCLVFWGHGPELLLESVPEGRTSTSGRNGKGGGGKHNMTNGEQYGSDAGEGRLYFTPIQLANGLAEAYKKTRRKIDIIGLDACSMSMAEFAYELRAYADFMIASQEEVPDFSFPYNELVRHFADDPGPVEDLCKESVGLFMKSYRDFIFDSETATKAVTLSALDLRKLEAIKNPLGQLAGALRGSSSTYLAESIYQARRLAHGFVGGLFVDICDFCDKLAVNCEKLPKDKIATDLKIACEEVSRTIRLTNNGTGCVIANEAKEDHCNGLSIYFPYLNDDDQKKVEQPLVGKGPGGDGGKDVSIVNTAATNALYVVRREIIKDTETYYTDPNFGLETDTGWYEFIQSDWSRILAKKAPTELDRKYSAQQCAQNLLLTGLKMMTPPSASSRSMSVAGPSGGGNGSGSLPELVGSVPTKY